MSKRPCPGDPNKLNSNAAAGAAGKPAPHKMKPKGPAVVDAPSHREFAVRWHPWDDPGPEATARPKPKQHIVVKGLTFINKHTIDAKVNEECLSLTRACSSKPMVSLWGGDPMRALIEGPSNLGGRSARAASSAARL